MASTTAFVLGGGGPLGAHEVGRLQGLLGEDIVPDLVVGTSIGAVNGAIIASGPSLATVGRLAELWTSIGRAAVFQGSVGARLATMFNERTHIFDNSALRRLVAEALPVERIEDLAVPFECVAASIERANAHYFTNGSIVDAVVASDCSASTCSSRSPS